MKNMSRQALIITGLLMTLIMVAAIVLTFSGLATREKHQVINGLSVGAQQAESINITDMNGDGERDIFVQDAGRIRVLDQQGNTVLSREIQGVTSTQGDADGDGVPDILAFSRANNVAGIVLFSGQDETVWETQVADLGQPGRAASVDFDADGRTEFVVGDQSGLLVALSADGEELWRYAFAESGSLRALDDVRRPGGDFIVAGLEEGAVVVLDGNGTLVWEMTVRPGLRRLRAFPVDDPSAGRILIGSTGGRLTMHHAETGDQISAVTLGQAVNEIRPVEADGDPATTEIAVGGRNGGVWALSQELDILWRSIMADKVNELAGINDAEAGHLVIAGDDTGQVSLYDANGDMWHSFKVSGSVSRLEVGRIDGNEGFIAAGGRQMVFYHPEMDTAPILYTPLLGGLFACLVVAGAAYVLTSMEKAPTFQVSAQDMTVESQRARRRMLHESITDLKELKRAGEVAPNAYLARMKELRSQLASSNEALMVLGEAIKPETFSCPHCNGTLELGADRCEYCGQIVIT